jgi:hypothetical protein
VDAFKAGVNTSVVIAILRMLRGVGFTCLHLLIYPEIASSKGSFLDSMPVVPDLNLHLLQSLVHIQ